MGYASLGIPAAMIMFQSMGERMNKVFSVIIRKVKTFWGCSRTEVSSSILPNLVHVFVFFTFCMQYDWDMSNSRKYENF